MVYKCCLGWRKLFEWGAALVIALLVIHAVNAQAINSDSAAQLNITKTPKQLMAEHTDDLRALMQFLYDEHPDELAKSTQVSAREMTEWVFDGKTNWQFDAIRRTQQTEAIALIFDPGYTGDHILAIVVGLETLLFNAYGGKNEYDIPGSIDENQVAHAACQLEGLQGQLEANAKQVVILRQASSRQNIQQTLQTIIQRIRGQLSMLGRAKLTC